MNSFDKVIWSEGMFLRPQHFQQQERYLERQLIARSQRAEHYFWGFSELQLEPTAFSQGRFAIKSAKGVFKDGTNFVIDESTQLPELEIPAATKNELVGLAIPTRQASSQQVSYEEGEDILARYAVTEQEVLDTTDTTLGSVSLQLGRLQIRLMLESEVDGNYEFLPMARIKGWDSKNAVALDTTYIPATLNFLEVRNDLFDFVVTTVDLLNEQVKRLARRLSVSAVQSGSSSMTQMMMLNVINRYHAYFHHIRTSNYHHPEKFFCHLQMLLNEMAVFLSENRAMDKFERYNHDDLQACFAPLMAQLAGALNIVLEDPYEVIELVDKGHGIRVGQVHDLNLIKQADFILGVEADMPMENLRKRFPSQAKFGPVERIRDLVHLQLPGVHLQNIDQIPPQLPYHSGYVYFALEQSGDLWQQFAKSGVMALHLAGEFPGLEMEFWAVRNKNR
ncbi:MAG: type VI secretion system baseplate subunit TssK [Alcaligenaceae bacterium]|nr:type VI secretion system baseplate subunit TssK [Alcaligenaceae bacterium]